MKYKIGEIIQVRTDLIVGEIYCNENSTIGDTITSEMMSNLGKNAEIASYNQGKYLLKIEGYVAIHQTYTDDMLRTPIDELAKKEYTFNSEVEEVMAHLETIQLAEQIDTAIDNGDKDLFMKLTNEYRMNKKFLQKTI